MEPQRYDQIWITTAQIAGQLLASGHYTNVEFAVRTAREVIAAAMTASLAAQVPPPK
jgi:hypothetical protein